MMVKRWEEIKAAMSPERQAEINRRYQRLKAEYEAWLKLNPPVE